MESFDALGASSSPLFHGEPAAAPLHGAGTVRTLHESAAADARSPGPGQAELSAMHPDRDDIEWHYCRSGQAG